MFGNNTSVAKIRVIGVGGAGNNAVNRMIEANVTSADFYAVNTDMQPLMLSLTENRIQIGEKLTKGLGAGSDPEVGERAAEESKDKLAEICEGVDLLFIAAGMGGGTGTGAAPVLAKIAKEKGCLTVAFVTKPFMFEGKKRHENTAVGIANLKKYVDTLVVVPNDKLVHALPGDIPMVDALKIADDSLRQGICGISDLISKPSSIINLDFADVKAIIQNQGMAHMGVGQGTGENRIIDAVRQAVSSPLLETTIEGAQGVLLNVAGGVDLSLGQVYEAARLVQGVVDDSANIIFGANVDPELNGKVIVTVIATGFRNVPEQKSGSDEAKQAYEILLKEKDKDKDNREINREQYENKFKEETLINLNTEKTSAEPETETETAPERSYGYTAYNGENVKQPSAVSSKMRDSAESYAGDPEDEEAPKERELPSFVKKLFSKKN